MLEEDRPGEHLAGMAQEELEQQELCAGQLQPAVTAPDLVGPKIEGEIGESQALARTCHLAAAQQGSQPRQELLEGEGLDQVIVGAGVQAIHAVGYGVARGEHEHGRAVALPANVVALEPQGALERGSRRRLVVDHQDAHSAHPPRRT